MSQTPAQTAGGPRTPASVSRAPLQVCTPAALGAVMNTTYLRHFYLVLAIGGAGCGPLEPGELAPDEARLLEENESAISGCYSTINAKYLALGGAQGFLGLPLIPESVTSGGTGLHRSYQGGAIYKKNGGCAYAVQGGIAARWAELGLSAGPLDIRPPTRSGPSMATAG